jgi:hypothetical protein
VGWLARLGALFGRLSKDDITVIILIVGEASGVFAGFCPSWFTVSSPFFHEQEAKAGNVKRIRWGEAAATAIVLSTGWAVSYRQVSNAPLFASAAICLVFIAGYEYMIAHPATEDGKAPATTGASSTRPGLPLADRTRAA